MNPSFFGGLLISIAVAVVVTLLIPPAVGITFIRTWWTNVRTCWTNWNKRRKQQRIVRAGHSPPIELLFKGNDRWTSVVYTCRAAFSGGQCVPGGPIEKALWTHFPVDEVQTVCVAINHLMPTELREHQNDIIHTVICSLRAEDFLFETANKAVLPVGIQPFYNRDLIIVGENNLSDILLDMVKCYLPWKAWAGERTRRGDAGPRPDVHVELVRRFGRPASVANRPYHDAGMIALIPNPLNVHKRVLIFFGCHLEGQLALEDWLSGQEAAKVIEEIQKSDKGGCNALQVVVHREFDQPASMKDPETVKAIRNPEDRRRFWFTQLNSRQIGDTAVVNTDCSASHELFDVSLVAQLPESTQNELIRNASEVLEIPDLYWENEKCNFGFHVTLYEFLTHHGPDAHLKNQLGILLQQLRDALSERTENEGDEESDSLGRITARVRGFEFLPTAMVSYVDFLDDNGRCYPWLDNMRRWCERRVERAVLTPFSSPLLNAMRVPFPVHITLCRFNRVLLKSEQSSLIKLADEWRNRKLTSFLLEGASLTLATMSPFRDVKEIYKFKF